MQRDTFKTRVYFAKAIGRFLIVDYDDDAEARDLVAVERPAPGRVRVQRYQGQPYFGVVRVLEDYSPAAGVNQFPREIAC